ncbi:E3 ubiquitin-protein ligase KCMF1-like [Limulus polyphemus]|uniref:E3 ubiquitin-protein ligase KCMF1-like n=1 Tax=Limulus polyphemus TaxID=6850 RepID=A0ABM1STY1_LIMPO|nr:E3 ubiquitin-protein ligase KCMF1-like [Limulus polyphemus]
MQCILTRSDYGIYYGGETVSVDQSQSFTCPFCGKMGFSEGTLQEHVTLEHSENSFEVVCPICAASPSGEPNHVTNDFAAHLTLEHRSPRDLDEVTTSRQVRRISHPGRGISGARARRNQMQFNSSSTLPSLSPNSRDSINPLAELLSQLSGVRRSTNLNQSNTTSQLQQLQMQLQLERQQAQAARQHLERLPRRQNQTGGGTAVQFNQAFHVEPTTSPSASCSSSSYLLSRYTECNLTESEQQALEVDHADHSIFVQELLLTTLAEKLSVSGGFGSIIEKLDFSVDQEGSVSALSVNKDVEVKSTTSSKGSTQFSSSCLNLPQQRHALPSTQVSQTTQQVNQRPSIKSSTTHSAQQSSCTNINSCGQSCQDSMMQQSPLGPRAGASVFSFWGQSREGQASGLTLNRNPSHEGRSTSPSSTRRKVLRHVDDRNKSNEPPPP